MANENKRYNFLYNFIHLPVITPVPANRFIVSKCALIVTGADYRFCFCPEWTDKFVRYKTFTFNQLLSGLPGDVLAQNSRVA